MIDKYLKKQNISNDLQVRLRKYIEFIYRQEGNFTTQAEEILMKKLSPDLKQELLKESFSGFTNSIFFLNENFSEETMNKVVSIIKTRNFSPGEIICKVILGV